MSFSVCMIHSILSNYLCCMYRARLLGSPTIVQCADGCGRSGTLVAIEAVLMQFLRGQFVHPPDCISSSAILQHSNFRCSPGRLLRADGLSVHSSAASSFHRQPHSLPLHLQSLFSFYSSCMNISSCRWLCNGSSPMSPRSVIDWPLDSTGNRSASSPNSSQ